jgi:ATP-binding cassette subfamily C exporter for protease/lipase
MKIPFAANGPLLTCLRSFRREFLWVGLFSMIVNLLMLTPTVYMLQLYDRVFKSHSELTLLVVTLLMILFYFVMVIAEWLRSTLLVRGGVKLDESLNRLVFDASFEKNLKTAGAAPAEALSDLTTIRQFLTGHGIFAFFDIPWTPIYIAVIFLLNPFLGWVSVLFTIIQLLAGWLGHRATIHEIEAASITGRESSSFLQGKLRNIEAVHSMGMLPGLRRRWLGYHENSIAAGSLMHSKQHRQQAISKFVRYCMQSITLGAGALMVIEGRMSTGGMIAANVMMSKALQPLDLAISVWKPFIQAYDAFVRLETLLSRFPERPSQHSLSLPDGDVRIDGLIATVEGRQEPILHGLDFTIPKGSVVAVVGPSGSGKSTLARSLVGAWPEVKGNVLYDEQPIQSWSRDAIGPWIGYLPQDVELFEGSVAENIARFGDIDPMAVIEASRLTGIHEMLLRFPNGYNTQIGEAGGVLSGGQRQRIGLARALYGAPSFVVLDEPNANLDEAGERSLVQAIIDLKARGRTVLLVTHRMNILEAVDRLLVLKDGRIEHYGLRDGVLEVMRSKAQQKPSAQPQI